MGARQLPPEERAQLAEGLLESLQEGSSPEIETAWDAEVLKRISAYAEPQRKYHTLQHLTECLEWFERVREIPKHAAEVELALWFHDAVYDVEGSHNELRSADWAAAELADACVAPEVIGRVSALILAT